MWVSRKTIWGAWFWWQELRYKKLLSVVMGTTSWVSRRWQVTDRKWCRRVLSVRDVSCVWFESRGHLLVPLGSSWETQTLQFSDGTHQILPESECGMPKSPHHDNVHLEQKAGVKQEELMIAVERSRQSRGQMWDYEGIKSSFWDDKAVYCCCITGSYWSKNRSIW